MAKGMQKYFRENFCGAETANIQPSESFKVYDVFIVTMHGANYMRTCTFLITFDFS